MSEERLRQHLLAMLSGGNAHSTFEAITADIPEAKRGEVIPKVNRSMWQVIEHLRICQRDILEYMLSAKYKIMNFPDDYWPKESSPPFMRAWDESIEGFKMDLGAITNIVRDRGNDLYAQVPTSNHTLLRELLLVSEHNSYHIGQLMYMRHLLNIDSEDLT